jgi:ABC-2 type transport system ATP-binding protein
VTNLEYNSFKINTMSIKVNQLTKQYGAQFAIDNISFEAKKGEVLGFLGPNGAGKTTTMKILTCYLPQTSGQAEVCGYDVSNQSLEVRQHVGYLPENNPLYKEMYVREYLEFIAGLHRLDKKQQKVSNIIDRVGLGQERHKQISMLSRGYKQRVGLAQAMLHDPDVLILDEPTSGLDPNQIQEIRQLIKDFGREKTVIFSTHIMQEVQAICDRVLIINHGKIVADDSIATLQQRVSGEMVVTVEFAGAVSAQQLSNLRFVSRAQLTDLPNRFRVYSKQDIRADLFKWAVENKQIILEMRRDDQSIESIFQTLTQN